MKYLNNVSLNMKLIGGFLLVAAMVAVVGVTGMFGLNITGKNFDWVMDREVPLADASMEAMNAVISGRDIMGEYLLTEDLAKMDEIADEFKASVKKFDEKADFIAKTVHRSYSN